MNLGFVVSVEGIWLKSQIINEGRCCLYCLADTEEACRSGVSPHRVPPWSAVIT